MDRVFSRRIRKIAVSLAVAPLSGCASVAIEAATVAVDKVQISRNIDDARAGDPDAQFAVGNALCCSGDAAEGSVYNTAEALTWLCRSAEQGNTDAMQKLGQIFEGDQIDGLRTMRRLFTATQDVPENLAAAYYWYARAGIAGQNSASETAAELYLDMSTLERQRVRFYLDGTTTPCGWNDLHSDPLTGPIDGQVVGQL